MVRANSRQGSLFVLSPDCGDLRAVFVNFCSRDWLLIYDLGKRRVELRGDDHWIADNATVIGTVILEHNAGVWFDAVLRGDNKPIHIGENTNIQNGAVLHTDIGQPLTLGKVVRPLTAEQIESIILSAGLCGEL